MNTQFTLKDVKFVVAGEAEIQIGELTTRVEDYNLLDGLKVAQAMPAIIRDLKEVFVEAIYDIRNALEDDGEAQALADLDENINNLTAYLKAEAQADIDAEKEFESSLRDVVTGVQSFDEKEYTGPIPEVVSVPVGDDGVMLTAVYSPQHAITDVQEKLKNAKPGLSPFCEDVAEERPLPIPAYVTPY